MKPFSLLLTILTSSNSRVQSILYIIHYRLVLSQWVWFIPLLCLCYSSRGWLLLIRWWWAYTIICNRGYRLTIISILFIPQYIILIFQQSLSQHFVLLYFLFYTTHYTFTNRFYLNRFWVCSLLELLYLQDVNHLCNYLLKVTDLCEFSL